MASGPSQDCCLVGLTHTGEAKGKIETYDGRKYSSQLNLILPTFVNLAFLPHYVGLELDPPLQSSASHVRDGREDCQILETDDTAIGGCSF
jgi:hypothetical protein